MAIDPEKQPKEFLTIAVAVGLLIFSDKVHPDDVLSRAEKFVAAVEQKYGPLNQAK